MCRATVVLYTMSVFFFFKSLICGVSKLANDRGRSCHRVELVAV